MFKYDFYVIVIYFIFTQLMRNTVIKCSKFAEDTDKILGQKRNTDVKFEVMGKSALIYIF
jgi:hypothetical protein